MAFEEIFSQLCLWMVILCLQPYIFSFQFILYLPVWIRIRIRNTDPDPQRS